MTRSLLCMTTADQLELTLAALASLRQAAVPDLDIVIIDDASTDGTPARLRAAGYEVIAKASSTGVTDSWNQAYRLFRDRGYDHLILANNDIVVPKGAIQNLLMALTRYPLCGPVTTLRGAGHQPLQDVALYHRLTPDHTHPGQTQQVQDRITAAADDPAAPIELPYLNGFFLAMTRAVIVLERPDGLLFDPRNRNTRNEDDLCARLPGPKVCCPNAFVFHHKAASFAAYRILGQTVIDRDLPREEARRRRWRPDRLISGLYKALRSWLRRSSADQ